MRKPPLPEFDPRAPRKAQANLEALGAYIQANGGGPAGPEADRRRAARRRPGPRRRAVPAQLLLVPQLHRSRRRAVVGQVRPDAGPGQRRADLHRDAHRAAEHAQVLRPAAHAGGEEGHHRLRQVGRRAATTTPAATRSAGSARRPRASIAFIVGLAAMIGFACGWERSHDHLARRSDTRRAATHSPTRPAELERHVAEQLAAAGRRASTTSRSCTTPPSGRSRAPGRRSAPSARSRCGSSSRRSAGLAFLAAFLFWPLRVRARPATPGYWVYAALHAADRRARSAWPCSRWASR